MLLPHDRVVLLRLDDNGEVHTPPRDMELHHGVWLGIHATRVREPLDQITAPSIGHVLGGRDAVWTTWEHLARASITRGSGSAA